MATLSVFRKLSLEKKLLRYFYFYCIALYCGQLLAQHCQPQSHLFVTIFGVLIASCLGCEFIHSIIVLIIIL